MTSPSQHADFILRLLTEDITGQFVSQEELSKLDVALLEKISKKNVVLIRVYEKLVQKNWAHPFQSIENRVTTEKIRIKETIGIIEKIDSVLKQASIPFVFSKAFQHYPDMGHDIDLLLGEEASTADLLLIGQLGLKPGHNSLTNKVAGKTGYDTELADTPLEIHHGRLGHVGEHKNYLNILFKNVTSSQIQLSDNKSVTTTIPSLNDQLLLCLLQRVYSHLYFRISDIVLGVKLLENPAINWESVLKTADSIGVSEGLRQYVSILNLSFKKIAGRDLACMAHLAGYLPDSPRELVYNDGHYQFGKVTLALKLYGLKCLHDLTHLHFDSLLRIALMPLLSITVVLRAIKRKFL